MPKAAVEKKEKKVVEKKEKKVKDPNAPKKPLGAYMFYCADARADMKKEFPDLKVTEMATKLGAAWKALDDKQKKKYQDKAEKDKGRYAKAMETYSA
ncbi:hypothetical protein FOA52_005048 [Chlamydomonas sp. UWO 241]|nr:hypothetical protein FOA52_005048 [Chlamydomonas sp. UWO 241]